MIKRKYKRIMGYIECIVSLPVIFIAFLLPSQYVAVSAFGIGIGVLCLASGIFWFHLELEDRVKKLEEEWEV